MRIGISDADLVKAALGGDQAAFDELARRYRDAAYGIAFHRLGDFEAARDVSQQSLVTAYRKLRMLRDHSKFGNWLYRITDAAAASEIRRSRFTLSLDDPDAPTPCAKEPGPAATAEQAEKSAAVRAALETLSEPDRLAVVLRYVNGYTHREIGEILGTSVSAVKSRIHRARRRLREEMLEKVEKGLKESVLDQLPLRPLRYSVSWERYTKEYAEILQIKVTEVFGQSPIVAIGGNYLVCGEYRLTGDETIELRLAIRGTSTGYQAFLSPGSGEFVLYAHVLEHKSGGSKKILSILMPDDTVRVYIHLEE